MNRFGKLLAVPCLAFTLVGLPALAQEEHHDDARAQEHRDTQRHDEWRRGGHINHDDWDRGQRVDDWRGHHLRRPPRGYEWRNVDGRYVLANPDGRIYQVRQK